MQLVKILLQQLPKVFLEKPVETHINDGDPPLSAFV